MFWVGFFVCFGFGVFFFLLLLLFLGRGGVCTLQGNVCLHLTKPLKTIMSNIAGWVSLCQIREGKPWASLDNILQQPRLQREQVKRSSVACLILWAEMEGVQQWKSCVQVPFSHSHPSNGCGSCGWTSGSYMCGSAHWAAKRSPMAQRKVWWRELTQTLA